MAVATPGDVAVELHHRLGRINAEHHVLLRHRLLNHGMHVGGGDIHHIGLAAHDVDWERPFLQSAELRVAHCEPFHALRHVEPYLAYFVIVHLLHAERTHVEAKSFLRGLYAYQGALLPVLVVHCRALQVGGQVVRVKLKGRNRYVLCRKQGGEAQKEGKNVESHHVMIVLRRKKRLRKILF